MQRSGQTCSRWLWHSGTAQQVPQHPQHQGSAVWQRPSEVLQWTTAVLSPLEGSSCPAGGTLHPRTRASCRDAHRATGTLLASTRGWAGHPFPRAQVEQVSHVDPSTLRQKHTGSCVVPQGLGWGGGQRAAGPHCPGQTGLGPPMTTPPSCIRGGAHWLQRVRGWRASAFPDPLLGPAVLCQREDILLKAGPQNGTGSTAGHCYKDHTPCSQSRECQCPVRFRGSLGQG